MTVFVISLWTFVFVYLFLEAIKFVEHKANRILLSILLISAIAWGLVLHQIGKKAGRSEGKKEIIEKVIKKYNGTINFRSGYVTYKFEDYQLYFSSSSELDSFKRALKLNKKGGK